MSLTAPEMKRLEDDAREMASDNCRGYLSDALQCLRDTCDPIAPLELLHLMWGTGHAKRPDQKTAVDDAGLWLEERLGREPGISPDRLALELGWLRRLVAVHADSDNARRDQHGPGRDPAFGAHIERLRQSRQRALASDHPAPQADRKPDPPTVVRPERLPDSFEVRFTLWQEAIDAFKNARERRKKNKKPKERFLAVQPVAAELQPLATDLACSMLDTEGMEEVQERTGGDPLKLPSFWIAVADLVDRDGMRVPRRISFR